MAIPVVISQLGHTMVHTADSIIIGQFAGTIPLAAVSLVNSLFTIVLVIGLGISYGLTPLIAQENGRGNLRECGRLLSNSLLINTVAGILLFFFLYFFMQVIIDKLDQQPEVIVMAKPYLKLLGLSLLPLMIFNTFKQFAEGLGFTRQAMVISIAGNTLNIILGIIFVKGLFGIEPMGVKGVGWSTLIDRILMALVMSFYVFRSKNFKNHLKTFAFNRINKLRSLRILKIGAPVAMQYTFEVGAFSGAVILMGTMGAIYQASHQIAMNLASATYMMSSGIAAAATIQTGHSFGRRDFSRLKLSANASYHIIIAFMILTAASFIIFHSYLPYIFTTDRAVIIIASQLLIIAGFFQLFDGTQVVGLGVLRGIGDVNIPTLITFIAYWIIGLPLAYLLGVKMGLGPEGIWYGLTVGLFISAVLLYKRYKFLVNKIAGSG